VWSKLAQQVVSRLIAELPAETPAHTRAHAKRLSALPIGCGLWSSHFLRANGEVVVVGDDVDHPDVDTVYTEHSHVLRALVWGSQRYPEMRQLLPVRGPGAVDCRCQAIPLFAEGKVNKVLCDKCGGLGWVPSAEC
jgi:hypothetical protein